jgi:hypothetical protein
MQDAALHQAGAHTHDVHYRPGRRAAEKVGRFVMYEESPGCRLGPRENQTLRRDCMSRHQAVSLSHWPL